MGKERGEVPREGKWRRNEQRNVGGEVGSRGRGERMLQISLRLVS